MERPFVSKLFEIMGVPVYNADEKAKIIVSENLQIKDELISLIGPDCFIEGNLNKSCVANFIFSSQSNLQMVNSIIHPHVFEDFKEWEILQKSDIVALESAILYESGFNKLVDFVASVYAPLQVRVDRTIVRDRSTYEQVMARIKSQMDEEVKKSMADYVIQNDETKELMPQIEDVINILRGQNK